MLYFNRIEKLKPQNPYDIEGESIDKGGLATKSKSSLNDKKLNSYLKN